MSYEVETKDVKISDLQPYQNRFNIVFKVVEKSEERTVNNRNNPDESHRLCDVTVADASGSIILTAWDDDIDLLESEKVLALNNGFVNVFRDSMRLSRGKFGAFEDSEDEISVNLDNNRSEEVHERRQRRRDNFRQNDSYSSSNKRQNDRFDSSYRRW